MIKINGNATIKGSRIKYSNNILSPILYLDASIAASYPGTGTEWYDISGQGMTASLVNTPTYNSGVGSFTFNGTNQYASVVPTSTLNAIDGFTNSYTVEVWVKSTDPVPSNAFGARVIEKRGALGGYPLSWQTNFNLSERLGLVVFDDTNVALADAGNLTTLWNGSWHQVVMVVNNSTDQIIAYRDGVQVNSVVNTTTTNATNTSNLYIAINGGLTTPYTGDISIVRIYNTALNAEEINANWLFSKNRFGV